MTKTKYSRKTKREPRKSSKPDKTEWRKLADWHPTFTGEYTEEDYAEDQVDVIAHEFWVPKGKKYPVFGFSLRHGMDPEDYSKRKGVSFSINHKRDKKCAWRSGHEILTIPPIIALRFGVFISDKVPLDLELREMEFERTQKGMAAARKRSEQRFREGRRVGKKIASVVMSDTRKKR